MKPEQIFFFLESSGLKIVFPPLSITSTFHAQVTPILCKSCPLHPHGQCQGGRTGEVSQQGGAHLWTLHYCFRLGGCYNAVSASPIRDLPLCSETSCAISFTLKSHTRVIQFCNFPKENRLLRLKWKTFINLQLKNKVFKGSSHVSVSAIIRGWLSRITVFCYV